MNPSYQPTHGANNVTNPQSQQNNVKPFVPKSHNYFPDMKNIHYTTARYGVVQPFFCEPVVDGDHITLRNSLKTFSNPLQSIMLTPIKAKKINAFVPMNAILPFAWDYIYKNPSQGDDVPDDANCVIKNFQSKLNTLYNYFKALYTTFAVPTSTPDRIIFLKKCIYSLLTIDNTLSSGSLLFNLGYKIRPYIIGKPINVTIDTVIDNAWSYILNWITDFSIQVAEGPNGIQRIYIIKDDSTTVTNIPNVIYLTPRAAIDIIRVYYNRITNMTLVNTPPTRVSIPDILLNTQDSGEPVKDINIGALAAYQLSCYQFFVNSKVDAIYNAELWRQAFQYLILDCGIELDNFTYNGNSIQYDVLSQHYLELYFSSLFASQTNTYTEVSVQSYLTNIEPLLALFSFNNALKYGDYFTGARTRALGVDTAGWLDAPVVNNKVSAIDTTKSIIMQRFLNALVKIGNSAEDYKQMLSGRPMPPDFHNPQFISADDEDIQTYEIQNNSNEDTGDIVTRIQSGGSMKMEYSMDVDLHGYVIGLFYFYCPRAYSQTKRRWFFHTDRYDMFNPMLQNIGDQQVFMEEMSTLGIGVKGYQGRNEEYKQSYSQLSGAFLDALNSWVFSSDELNNSSSIGLNAPITPETIRSFPSEFDRFFSQNTGYSLSHSYHFICAFMNGSEFVRPMAQQPTIL